MESYDWQPNTLESLLELQHKLSAQCQAHQHDHVGSNMETKLTKEAQEQLDSVYDSIMKEFNDKKCHVLRIMLC